MAKKATKGKTVRLLRPPEPQTLDDLLLYIPGMRKMRSINASLLRTLLDRPKKHCTWCGGKVTKGRSTWCGDACVKEYQLRCDAQTQLRFVIDRDKGICQVCDRDTVEAVKLWAAKRTELETANPGVVYRYGDLMKQHAAAFGYGRGHWSEVDHIIPVSEGGGLLGPKNLRLLCGQCHLMVTSKLASKA